MEKLGLEPVYLAPLDSHVLSTMDSWAGQGFRKTVWTLGLLTEVGLNWKGVCASTHWRGSHDLPPKKFLLKWNLDLQNIPLIPDFLRTQASAYLALEHIQ